MLIASLPHPSTPLTLTPMGLYEANPQPFLQGLNLQLVRACTLCMNPRRSTGRQTGEARHPKPPIHHLLNSCPWLPHWAPYRQLQLPCSALGWRGTKRVHRILPGGSQPLHTKHSKAALHVLNSNPWRMAPKKRWVQKRKGQFGGGAGAEEHS